MDWKQLTSDFKQKYELSYCHVTLEGYTNPRVFWLDLVETTASAPLLHLHNRDVGEVILRYDDSKSDIEFKFPSIGLYNYRNAVIMVRRLYGRQWKKGVCGSTIRANPIYSQIASLFSIEDEGHVNEELITKISEPTPTISLTEGINVLDKALATCLSSEFALGLSTKDAHRAFILWYYENPIGMVDPETKRIYLRETQFKQEFNDFVTKIRGASEYSLHC